jgi:DNA-directed RNA polymerase subunit L
MELKLVSKSKDSIEVEIAGEDETMLYPLQQKLLEDKSVVFATYEKGHPMLDNPKLIVKVKEGKPQAALKRAAKALANDFKQFRELFEKASA